MPGTDAVRGLGEVVQRYGLPEQESDELLAFLFEHQVQPKTQVDVPRERATVVLVIDASLSMQAKLSVLLEFPVTDSEN